MVKRNIDEEINQIMNSESLNDLICNTSIFDEQVSYSLVFDQICKSLENSVVLIKEKFGFDLFEYIDGCLNADLVENDICKNIEYKNVEVLNLIKDTFFLTRSACKTDSIMEKISELENKLKQKNKDKENNKKKRVNEILTQIFRNIKASNHVVTTGILKKYIIIKKIQKNTNSLIQDFSAETDIVECINFAKSMGIYEFLFDLFDEFENIKSSEKSPIRKILKYAASIEGRINKPTKFDKYNTKLNELFSSLNGIHDRDCIRQEVEKFCESENIKILNGNKDIKNIDEEIKSIEEKYENANIPIHESGRRNIAKLEVEKDRIIEGLKINKYYIPEKIYGNYFAMLKKSNKK